MASLVEPRHEAEPLLTIEFLFCNSLGHVQEFLRDQAFELSKRLLLKKPAHLFSSAGIALANNQLTEILEQGAWRIQHSFLQFFPALKIGQLVEFTARQ